MTSLEERYQKEIREELKKELGLKNIMEVPKLEKIVINVGVGRAVDNPKILNTIMEEIALITGQRPIKTRAKKSEANFKLRKGMPIGVKVTLRGKRMYTFLEKLIYVALPRVRDFQGLSRKSFDKWGNYTFGIKEQIIFPEIDIDKVDFIHGMDITLVIKNVDPSHSEKLLEKLGFPLERR